MVNLHTCGRSGSERYNTKISLNVANAIQTTIVLELDPDIPGCRRTDGQCRSTECNFTPTIEQDGQF